MFKYKYIINNKQIMSNFYVFWNIYKNRQYLKYDIEIYHK